MTCPGDKCPMPASMSGVDRRVAAARSTYDRAGYTGTSHHLTSIGTEQSAPDRARVSAHLQAWHVRKDGATVLGLGTWTVDARKTGSGWRIVEETLESPCVWLLQRRSRLSEAQQKQKRPAFRECRSPGLMGSMSGAGAADCSSCQIKTRFLSPTSFRLWRPWSRCRGRRPCRDWGSGLPSPPSIRRCPWPWPVLPRTRRDRPWCG